jgi:hypothetical protein
MGGEAMADSCGRNECPLTTPVSWLKDKLDNIETKQDELGRRISNIEQSVAEAKGVAKGVKAFYAVMVAVGGATSGLLVDVFRK